MGRGRLEAFSDGVIAIILTIMLLELHVPRDQWANLRLLFWLSLVPRIERELEKRASPV